MLKRFAFAVLNQSSAARHIARLRTSRYAVFMLHRFQSSDGGGDAPTHGRHDPDALDQILTAVRASGIHTVPLDTLVAGLTGTGPLPKGPAIAFTVDECYPDFADVALPVFRSHECHVTGFVVPHVIDGTAWFWWDQVQYILRHAKARSLTFELEGEPRTLGWTDAQSRVAAGDSVTERLKSISADSLELAIRALADVADVPLPVGAPFEYAVLNWDRLRELEAGGGVQFGAHTLTHPILSRCTDARAAWEIQGSVARVRSELRNPSQVFSYPVGRTQDFTPRDEALVADLGLLGAVSAVGGHAPVGLPDGARWRIPRFAHDERPGAALRLVLL